MTVSKVTRSRPASVAATTHASVIGQYTALTYTNMSDNENKTVNDENNENEKFGRVQFSHEQLVKLTKEAIDKVIESDPVFRGIPLDATAEEIRAQTAVAQGQAITLYLERQGLAKLAIVVPPHTTTVLDLKKAIKRYTDFALRREKVKKKISWKHIWKKYHLRFNDTVLENDTENIKNYGITNKVELCYTKRLRQKNRN